MVCFISFVLFPASNNHQDPSKIKDVQDQLACQYKVIVSILSKARLSRSTALLNHVNQDKRTNVFSRIYKAQDDLHFRNLQFCKNRHSYRMHLIQRQTLAELETIWTKFIDQKARLRQSLIAQVNKDITRLNYEYSRSKLPKLSYEQPDQSYSATQPTKGRSFSEYKSIQGFVKTMAHIAKNLAPYPCITSLDQSQIDADIKLLKSANPNRLHPQFPYDPSNVSEIDRDDTHLSLIHLAQGDTQNVMPPVEQRADFTNPPTSLPNPYPNTSLPFRDQQAQGVMLNTDPQQQHVYGPPYDTEIGPRQDQAQYPTNGSVPHHYIFPKQANTTVGVHPIHIQPHGQADFKKEKETQREWVRQQGLEQSRFYSNGYPHYLNKHSNGQSNEYANGYNNEYPNGYPSYPNGHPNYPDVYSNSHITYNRPLPLPVPAPPLYYPPLQATQPSTHIHPFPQHISSHSTPQALNSLHHNQFPSLSQHQERVQASEHTFQRF